MRLPTGPGAAGFRFAQVSTGRCSISSIPFLAPVIACLLASAGLLIPDNSFLAASRERDRLQQLEYEQRRAEAAAEQEREARQQAAIAKSECDQRLREEMREQANRQYRDRQLSDLHSASIRNEQFRNAVVRSQAHANARQRLKSVLFPPEPPPLPEPPETDSDPIGSYFGEPGFSVELWSKRRRSWW